MPRLADLVWHQDDNVNTEINTKSFIAPKSIPVHLLDPLSKFNYVSAFLGHRKLTGSTIECAAKTKPKREMLRWPIQTAEARMRSENPSNEAKVPRPRNCAKTGVKVRNPKPVG